MDGADHKTGSKIDLSNAYNILEDEVRKYYPDCEVLYKWNTEDCITLDKIPYIGVFSHFMPNMYIGTGFNKWGMTSSMVAARILTDQVAGRENPYAPVFSPSRSILHPQLAINTFEAITNLLSISGKRCPHMGCALKWNAQEHSWDCPCHGSRFTEDGKCIDNPSTGNLKNFEE